MTTLSTSPRQQPITVAVIDKNPLVVRGLDQMLREDGRFELVMSAPNGDDFLSEYAARGVAAPIDIAVTGWVMPKGDGRSLLSVHPRRTEKLPQPRRQTFVVGQQTRALNVLFGHCHFHFIARQRKKAIRSSIDFHSYMFIGNHLFVLVVGGVLVDVLFFVGIYF